jgi:Transcriptional regulator
MKVDWDHLQYFLVLARAKTLTNTARIIGVEHSTVSRRIHALELALGTPLFKREATGYELTLEGLALVPRVEQMEQAFYKSKNPTNLCKVVCELAHPKGLEQHF